MLSRGVVDMLVDGALNFLRCMVDVVHPDVVVTDFLAEIMVASSRE